MNTTTDNLTPWAALPVLLAGAFMVVLDFFIVNVALPSIATDLGAGESSLEWVVAGAVVMPQVLAIVGVTYRGPDYVRAMSLYGLALGLAAVGGQVIGGALVETDVAGLGWRSCFLINVPIGIAALALTPRLVPESRAQQRRRIDVAGAVLVAVGLTAVLLPLIQGREQGWPAWTWSSLAVAPVLLG